MDDDEENDEMHQKPKIVKIIRNSGLYKMSDF